MFNHQQFGKFDPEEFRSLLAAAAEAHLPKAKAIREVWPAISDALAKGMPHQVIVEKLNEAGLGITMGAFKSTLQRIRKEDQERAQGMRARYSSRPPRMAGMSDYSGGMFADSTPLPQPRSRF